MKQKAKCQSQNVTATLFKVERADSNNELKISPSVEVCGVSVLGYGKNMVVVVSAGR